MIELNTLRVYEAVVSNKSFSKAADELLNINDSGYL